MKMLVGDIVQMALEGRFDVIIHGCNCFNTMGAGVALQIKRTFPEAYEADLKTKKGDISKLGSYSKAEVTRGSKGITIINAYTQYKYGNSKYTGSLVSYEAIDKIFKTIAKDYIGLNKRIAYPKIGAGLAGGNWNIIGNLIDTNLFGLHHTLVIKN